MKARDVLRLTGAAALAALATLLLPVAASAEPPVVTIDAPNPVETTRAHVSGEVTVPAEGPEVWWGFEYAVQGSGQWSPFPESGTVAAGESQVVQSDLTGLEADTTYEVRLFASDFGGTQAESPVETFTTDPAPVVPTLALDPATASYVSAQLSGSVDPEGGNQEAGGSYVPIHWALQISQSGDPGSFGDVGSGDLTEDGEQAKADDPIAVSAEPGGLSPATTYHYRLLVTYAGQTAESIPGGEFTTLPVATPTVSVDPASSIDGFGAHFSGSVEVSDPDPAFTASCHFEYVSDSSFSQSEWAGAAQVPCQPSQVQGSDPQPVAVAADADLEPNTIYHLRLVATNAGGSGAEVAPNFSTPAVGAEIERATLFEPTPTSIVLRALVNPRNSTLTDCRFEYGESGGPLDQSAPCGSSPSGNGFSTIAVSVVDLEPATKYDFRLVATNAAGTTEGDLRSFTTPELVGPQVCPNEAIREDQHATYLPDCRAFEMTSPLEKGNGDIVGDGFTNVAATDGNAISFSTRVPFGDTEGSGRHGQTQYIARRDADGWSTHAITPQARPEVLHVFFGPTRFMAFSDDLRTGVVKGYDLPGATDDVPLRVNTYVEDTESRALQTVTRAQGGLPDPLPSTSDTDALWGISNDARHVAFVSRVPFLPEAPTSGTIFGPPNVYQWDSGVLSLAGILPDGTIPSSGSDIDPIDYRDMMSDDGSRLLFTASDGGKPQLYQRVDGERTIWISETELDPSDPDYEPDPAEVSVRAATPDGHIVFFTSSTPLVDEDDNGSTDLYRYVDSGEPASEDNLTLIPGISYSYIIGVSDDGDRIYYHTLNNEIWVWDHGSSHSIIGGVFVNPNGNEKLGLEAWAPGQGRTSPDGKFLAFLTRGLPSGAQPMGHVTNHHRELYFYSLADDALRCVSCPAGPATADATVEPETTMASANFAMAGIRPRFLSDDGDVFFSTAEGLTSDDTNGVLDVYRYSAKTGDLRLISGGRGSGVATFAEAAPDGDDAFIVTRQRLAKSDTDQLVDVYDVRVDGGFAEPDPPVAAPCQGDSCQGAASVAPGVASPASTASSKGNLKPRRCRAGRRAKGRHGTRRCTGKAGHRKTKKHRANNDRRTNR